MEESTGTSPFRTHRPPTEMYKNARLAATSVNFHSPPRANQLRQPTQRIALFHTPVFVVLLSLALRHILVRSLFLLCFTFVEESVLEGSGVINEET
jgi:hypothetical protein